MNKDRLRKQTNETLRGSTVSIGRILDELYAHNDKIGNMENSIECSKGELINLFIIFIGWCGELVFPLL